MRIVLMIHERKDQPVICHSEDELCTLCNERAPVIRVVIDGSIVTKHFGYINDSKEKENV